MTTMEALVNRFLGWKLPKTFSPDAGIQFKPSNGMTREDAYARPGWWPIGTNLFTADEAQQMLTHLLGTPTRTWVIGKQHPERAEVSMFTTSSEHTAKEYERLGWTVRIVDVLPAAGVAGIDGPRHGPAADGSQKPNDAAAIPCAKAGSNRGVAPSAAPRSIWDAEIDPNVHDEIPRTRGVNPCAEPFTAKAKGLVAGDGEPCPNDHDPDCRWPECLCRTRGVLAVDDAQRIADLEEEVRDVRRWYGSRLGILSAWAREHLQGEQLHTFFNIVANARPHVTDEPEWFRAVIAKLAAKERNAGVPQRPTARRRVMIDATKFPQLAKMQEIQETSQAIGEFLEWLSEHRIDLCSVIPGTGHDRWAPITDGTEKLLARYFDIDLNAVERERRAALAEHVSGVGGLGDA